jgi:hypothetical protein
MHKSALVLAVTLAACFTATNAKAQSADAAYEWNVKNIPPMAAPAPMTAPAPVAAPDAAKPAKVAKASKKKAKKTKS